MIRHLARAGAAIEADQRNVQRMHHGGRGGDVRSHQQRAGGLDRHLHEDRNLAAGAGGGALGGVDRRLDLQRILAGLDQDGVDAARRQSRALDAERILERLVFDMAERREPRSRPDRADDEANPAVGLGRFGRRLARDFAGAAVDVMGLVGQVEFGERDGRAAEAVGLHRVGAGAEMAQMDAADDIGAGLVQHLDAVLAAAVIAFEIERVAMHRRAHGAVAQQDPFAQNIEDMRHRLPRRLGDLRRDGTAHADHVADGDDQIGAVEGVEMEILDAVRLQKPALLGGDRGRHQAAGIGIVVEPVEHRRPSRPAPPRRRPWRIS